MINDDLDANRPGPGHPPRAVLDHGADPQIRGGDPGRLPRRQEAGLGHRRRPDSRRDAPVRRSGTGRRRGLRAAAHRRRGHRDPPAAPLRARPRRRHERDGRRDLRPGNRSGPRPGRAHAPVRPGGAFLLLRDHRRGLSAGAGSGVRVQAAGRRRGGGGGDRRGRRQPGRVPRIAQSGGAVAAAGGVRGGGQRLGDLGARARRPRRSPTTRCAPPPTACPASGSRTTPSRGCTPPPGRQSNGPAPAAVPR